MKPGIILAVFAAIAISSGYAASIRVRRQLIPAEFRNIKIEDYLKNPRSVAFQLKCIVYDGPCDRIGKYLKVTIPELISGTCTACSPSDRQIAGKLVSHIQKNFPKEWHDAVKKFQGGQTVKPEDASRLESLLGVKIEPELVASTPAPAEVPAAPVAAAPVAVAQAPVAQAPVAVAAPVVPVAPSEVPAVAAAPVAVGAPLVLNVAPEANIAQIQPVAPVAAVQPVNLAPAPVPAIQQEAPLPAADEAPVPTAPVITVA